MKTRKLGNSDIETSEIGLGCMTMTGIYGPADETESIATIHAATDSGVSFIDTADAYGGGSNETLVGKAIADRRDKVVLATKFGNIYARDSERGADGRPEYVREACEASLKRLNIDVIDLYFQHRVDKEVPIEDTVGAMSDLVKAGKVRALGLSECSSETLRRAHAVHPISALQSELSLWTQFALNDHLPVCNELGVTYIAYSPLGRGMLTGSIKADGDMSEKDRRRDHPRFQGDNLKHNVAVIAPIEALAKAKGCTAAQIALAWVLAQGDNVLPIPGSKRLEHLNLNIAATEISLSDVELQELFDSIPPDFTAGSRYPDAQMWTVDL
ncbi:MAG: aldo/keto reductase [Rhodospirillaceae bacterium]|nr:aldo/keto reductase [Rhodospirillaceae bacterium]